MKNQVSVILAVVILNFISCEKEKNDSITTITANIDHALW